MLLTPSEQTETASPLGDEDSLDPNPDHPFILPALYLPSIGVSNAQGPGVKLRRMRNGRMVLLVYAAVDRLVKCTGPNQSWALPFTENLNDLAEKQPFDVITLDQCISQELWYQKERRYQWPKHLE